MHLRGEERPRFRHRHATARGRPPPTSVRRSGEPFSHPGRRRSASRESRQVRWRRRRPDIGRTGAHAHLVNAVARPYCSTSVLAWRLKSAGIVAPLRSGNSRWPNRMMIAIVPASSGTPTSANSKKPKPPTPASIAASETSTFTGVPVRPASSRHARRRRAASEAARSCR